MKKLIKGTVIVLSIAISLTFSGHSQVIYDADFSGSTPGFDHSTGNEPAAGTQLVGANWTIEAVDVPATDSGGNIFGVFGNGLLEAADYGGEGLFFSTTIDVSGWNEVALDFDAEGDFNTTSEFFQWEYTLDSLPTVVLGNVIGDTNGTATLDATVANLDVTGINNLVVGFRFDHNGGSDFVDVTNVQVDGVTPIPEPSSIALLGMGAAGLYFLRRRSA